MTDPRHDLASLRIDPSSRGRGPGRSGVWAAGALVLALTAAGAVWWWAGRVQAAPVRVITVQDHGAQEAGTVLNASGYVTARRRATVSSKVTGKIVDVLIEEGLEVRRGQVLARLDDGVARAALALAEAQLAAAEQALTENEVRLEEARLTLGRRVRLASEGVLGEAEVDAARAEVDSLAARLALAGSQVDVAARQVAIRRTELDDTTIRAPFDGIAVSKDAQPGEMVSPVSAGGGFTRTGIGTIVDMSSLEVEVDVNESFIGRVGPGQPVAVTLDAYPDWRIPAKVITTVPTADRQKATVRVRIAFDQLDPRILPDMGVKVAFLRDEPAAGADELPRLRVPRAAVRSEDGRDIVFLLRDSTAERRAVRLGALSGDEVEIVAGLAPGDRLIVDGPATLADGARVVAR